MTGCARRFAFFALCYSVLNRNDVFDTALSVDKNKSAELQQDASKATGDDEGTHQTAELSVLRRDARGNQVIALLSCF